MGKVSFSINQPAYGGIPAEQRDIERIFKRAGWQLVKQPTGHVIFFNFAFDALAIDIAARNCYYDSTSDDLLPFDVILLRPCDALRNFLKL